MNCDRSRELFADYLGEELDRKDAQELQLHLKACHGCRQELALLGSTRATLKRALPEVPMPQHLLFDFSKPKPQGWFAWLRQPRYATLAAATACFIICVASLALFRTQIRIGSAGFQVSFGSSPVTSVAPAPIVPQPSVAGLGKDDVRHLIDARLTELEHAQNVRFERTLTEVKNQWQTQRRQDWQQVSADLRYLEANQRAMVQDSVRNATYIQSLASNFYAKAETPAALR